MDLHALPNAIRLMKARTIRWVGHVAHVEEMRNAYKILVRKSEGGLRGRYRRRWEHNIRMDLREIRWEVMDWIHVAQDSDSGWLL
jgi:hypothetical protein